jgi:hypothetical protein
MYPLANPAAQNGRLNEDQEEDGRRARGLGPLERGRGSVGCDPDASGLTMVYLAGKLLP